MISPANVKDNFLGVVCTEEFVELVSACGSEENFINPIARFVLRLTLTGLKKKYHFYCLRVYKAIDVFFKSNLHYICDITPKDVTSAVA